MSIERYGGETTLQCDGCPDTYGPYMDDDFDVLIADARSDGWAVYKDRNGWNHRCPNCRSGGLEDFE